MEVGVFRIKDAAKYLGISVTTFWRYVKEGKIKKGLQYGDNKRITVWRKQWLDDSLDTLEHEQQTAGE